MTQTDGWLLTLPGRAGLHSGLQRSQAGLGGGGALLSSHAHPDHSSLGALAVLEGERQRHALPLSSCVCVDVRF